MDFDLQWLLIGLPLVFGLGWLAARFDGRQAKRDTANAPRAYFKGMNLLLNEQHDQAIDAFIEAVQDDPDTAELHFALGNLFRRRGEFERAVRVHEHLLHRGDLKAHDRARAQHALAQDFMKAGLFDRAESAFRALQDTAFEADSQLALLSLYERSRDWPAAAELSAKLGDSDAGSFTIRTAHYLCEMAEEAHAKGELAAATDLLRRAREAAPLAPRPMLLTGQLQAKGQHFSDAFATWQQLRVQHPAAFVLVAAEFAKVAMQCGKQTEAMHALQAAYAQQPSTEALYALDALECPQRAKRWGVHLREHVSLTAAKELLTMPQAQWEADTQALLADALTRAAQPLQRYRCAACAFETGQYFWQCPGCLTWDSYPTQKAESL